jgi:N-acyl homoserine lactone hydrolase
VRLDILFTGFPGRSDRGFLGWSSCVLVRSETGSPILFDTAGFNERVMLYERLGQLGMKPEDIGAVFLSHFHFDHVANVGMFPNAKIYLHEKEIAHIHACRNGNVHDPAVPHELFLALESSDNLRVLRGPRGRVDTWEWVLTPGHTPGLCSMLLTIGGKKWVLASDAVKNSYELETETVTMTLDPKASKQSIVWIKNTADVVIPGHDEQLILERTDESAIHVVKHAHPNITIEVPVQVSVRVVSS